MKQQTKKIFESYVECISEAIKTWKKGNIELKLIKKGDEYRVSWFEDGKYSEDKSYYTDDKEDAISTAEHMIKFDGKGGVNESQFDSSVKYDKKDEGSKTTTYYFSDTKNISAAKKDLESQGFKKNDKDMYVKGSEKAKIDVALTSKGGGTITFYK